MLRELRLPVGDGHTLYVEESGPPDGIPVVFLHGGPGSGCRPGQGDLFDATRYRRVLFDQRGAGRSMPLGSLAANTTAHLVADIERIRSALGIERWLVCGGSWGSLLALAYAQQHPRRVTGLVLRGIFLGSQQEVARYLAGADVPADCFARLLSGDAAARQAAARAWLDHERRLMGEPPLADAPNAHQLAKACIQAHYLTHACFSDEQALLGDCDRLRHLPGAIVQGSHDPVCPPQAAEELHRAWPQAEWVLVAGGGHGGLAPDMAAAFVAALDRVARCAS